MDGRTFVELIFDYFHSRGTPQREGARMAAYDPRLDRAELGELVARYRHAWEAFPYWDNDERVGLAIHVVNFSAEPRGLSYNSGLFFALACAVNELMLDEPGFTELELPNSKELTPFEVDKLKAQLRQRIRFLTDTETFETARDALFSLVAGILDALPESALANVDRDVLTTTVPLLSLIREPHLLQTKLLGHFLSNLDLQTRNLYDALTRQLYINALEASGVVVNPDLPLLEHDTDKAVFPIHCQREDPLAVAERYFTRTPLLKLLKADIPFVLPETARFEHMHIVAGTGHGKTQTLQHLIVSDLQRPAEQVPSMVILDSSCSDTGHLIHPCGSLAFKCPVS